MFRFPCPHCGQPLKGMGFVGGEMTCPKCGRQLAPQVIDNEYLREQFPLIKWVPVNDGRTSPEHAALASSGINGTAYYRLDDPVLAGWWAARRKGLRKCRCKTVETDKATAAKLGLPLELVPPLPFDPWSAKNTCERTGPPEPEQAEVPAAEAPADEPEPAEPEEPDMVRFRCGACGRKYRTSRLNAGKKTKCVKCGTPLTVPPPS